MKLYWITVVSFAILSASLVAFEWGQYYPAPFESESLYLIVDLPKGVPCAAVTNSKLYLWRRKAVTPIKTLCIQHD